MKVTVKSLLGAWRLRRWEVVRADGERTEPFGADADGLLLYTSDGWMSATIMAADRARLSHPNPRQAPAGERAAAFDGYFSYGGRWRLVDGCVHHEVHVALNPALTGTVQVRAARLTARTLQLSAIEGEGRARREHRITWRRPTVKESGRR